MLIEPCRALDVFPDLRFETTGFLLNREGVVRVGRKWKVGTRRNV